MLSLDKQFIKKQNSIILFFYLPFIIGIIFIMIFFPQRAKDLINEQIRTKTTTKPTETVKITKKHLDTLPLENQLISIVNEKNPRAALQKLKTITNDNKLIANGCHVLVHAIGRAAYEKYKVFDAALVFEDNTCGSGYIHGVVEARMSKAKNVIAELQVICKDGSGNCFHGVGHGLMYYTSNNLPTSLLYCDTIKSDQGKLFCSEGVFMENFNTDPTLHPTKYIKSDDPFYPCGEQKTLYKGTCYFYAPDHYLNIYPTAYEQALTWCATAEEGYELICLNGLGSRMMKRNILEPKSVEKVCMQLHDEKRSYCIDGMLSYYLVHHYSLEKGKALCAQLEKNNKQTCYHAVNVRAGLFPQ